MSLSIFYRSKLVTITLLSVAYISSSLVYSSCSVYNVDIIMCLFFFFQAEDGIRDIGVTGVQTCALPISQFSFLKNKSDKNTSHKFAIKIRLHYRQNA